MEMTGILQYWEQLIFFLGILIVAVRLQSEVTALRNDVSTLQDECKEANKKIQDNFVSSVRTESSVKEAEKKIESLFNLYNKV
jgi:peptidoglycan hydrolase CwlO-like protein